MSPLRVSLHGLHRQCLKLFFKIITNQSFMYIPTLQTKFHEPLIIGASYVATKANPINAFRPFSHFTGVYEGGQWVEQGDRTIFNHVFSAGPHTWDVVEDGSEIAWSIIPAPDERMN